MEYSVFRTQKTHALQARHGASVARAVVLNHGEGMRAINQRRVERQGPLACGGVDRG